MEDPELWVWLQSALGAGSAKLEMLLDRFENISGIFGASRGDLLEIPKLTKREIEALCDKSLGKSEDIVNSCMEKNYEIITPDDERYPSALEDIYARPCALYVAGSLESCGDGLLISLVGTRRITEYGYEAATKLAMGVVRNGAVVVSGMAKGVDSASHKGALKGGGKTIAVLGCGIDVNYPAAHAELKRLIMKNGAVISEYPPGTRPERQNFPMRNRIIAGLSRGTVVVEAGAKSGALITASLAAEMGRDVFAVPGSIFSEMSEGPNRLIRDGAKPVCSVADILEEYPERIAHRISLDSGENEEYETIRMDEIAGEPEKAPTSRKAGGPGCERPAEEQPPAGLSPVQEQVYAVLPQDEPVHVDELALRANLELRVVLVVLTSLEIQGLARSFPGRRYARMRPAGI